MNSSNMFPWELIIKQPQRFVNEPNGSRHMLNPRSQDLHG